MANLRLVADNTNPKTQYMKDITKCRYSEITQEQKWELLATLEQDHARKQYIRFGQPEK